jgi:hypothetical protein
LKIAKSVAKNVTGNGNTLHYSSNENRREETKHLKAQSQQQHHTEEDITEVEGLHPDKQGNGVQHVENQLTTQPNAGAIPRTM